MFDNSTIITTVLLFLLVGSYVFLTSTKTNFDQLECIRFVKQHLIKSGNKVKGVFFVPDHPVKKILLGLIYSERLYIKVAIYQLTDPDLLEALLDAHRRGVHVEIITDKSCLTGKYEKITELRKHGITVYVYGEKHFSLMHNKFWVFGRNLCNKKIIVSGSANATKNGTMRNEENIYIDDRLEIVIQYDEKFDRLKKKIALTNNPKPKKDLNQDQIYLNAFLDELRMIFNTRWVFE